MSKIKWDTRFPVTKMVVSLAHYCCYCYTLAEWWSQTLTTDKQHPCFHVGTSSMAGYTWVASRHMMLPHWILHLPLRTDRGLQVHTSCLASSCLHLSLLAHRPEPNSNQKEICHRSLGCMSQTQRVRLTLLNASVLCSILHSDSSTLISSPLGAGHTTPGQTLLCIRMEQAPAASVGPVLSVSHAGIFDTMVDPDLSGLHSL